MPASRKVQASTKPNPSKPAQSMVPAITDLLADFHLDGYNDNHINEIREHQSRSQFETNVSLYSIAKVPVGWSQTAKKFQSKEVDPVSLVSTPSDLSKSSISKKPVQKTTSQPKSGFSTKQKPLQQEAAYHCFEAKESRAGRQRIWLGQASCNPAPPSL